MEHVEPNPQDRNSYPHWHRITVRYADLDDQRHVNNSVYSVYCEESRRMMLEHMLPQIRACAVTLFVARLSIDFLREISYPATIDIGSVIARLGNSSYTVRHALFSEAGCHAIVEAVMVVVSRETRRPTPIPDMLRDLLQRSDR